MTNAEIAIRLRMLADKNGGASVCFVGDEPVFESVCKRLGSVAEICAETELLLAKAVYVKDHGLFTLGQDSFEAHHIASLFTGQTAPQKFQSRGGRLNRKIALVTGAGQGFGRAIALGLADEGAYVALLDSDSSKARSTADEINSLHGDCSAIALSADVSVEAEVEAAVEAAILEFGGLDILISCAGIVRAGGLDELSTEDFLRINSVNYNGFYFCAKYASRAMKLENQLSPDYFTDIIEINSKSGLSGSNRNFAYAGSKFGGIGLVQSFALELCAHKIKVNAVCPGNYLDGQLWSDPEHGLFRQYLEAGKVPGARSVADVRRYYESKVPLGRGCEPEDVLRAIFYLIEQKYETGQALPVTGGQIMLS